MSVVDGVVQFNARPLLLLMETDGETNCAATEKEADAEEVQLLVLVAVTV